MPHASFQSALAQGAQTGLDRLESKTIDDLLQFLEERIKSLLAVPLTDANSSLRNIYVLCDPNDWDSAYRLKACLESNQCAVWYPMRDVDDERVRLRDHQETLKSSDAVLLYWGSAQESWFRRSLRELIGARQKRRKRPLPALCLSCPPNPDRDQYQRPDVFFAQVHDLRCETVRPALRHLHTCGNGGGQ